MERRKGRRRQEGRGGNRTYSLTERLCLGALLEEASRQTRGRHEACAQHPSAQTFGRMKNKAESLART